MTGDDRQIKVVMVGGGQGAATVIASFADVPSVSICGLTDLRADAPGMVMAREHGITCFPDIASLLAQDGINLVFKLTGITRPFAESLAQGPA